MNSTIYSERNRLTPTNILKFRCRIDDQDGRDVHRDFTGVYSPRWRALYLDEMRLILNEYKVVPLFPFDVYTKEDGSHFFTSDFEVGKIVFLGKTASQRDKGAKTFVIVEVLSEALKTPTEAQMRAFLRDRDLPPAVVDLVVQVRNAFTQQAGGATELGIKDIGRRFRIIDADGNRKVNRSEFGKTLKDVHMQLSEAEVDLVFDAFDTDDDNKISYDEMLAIIRGPMNERRKKAVAVVFRKLDLTGDGVITLQDIRTRFNTAAHPDVLSGALTADQLLVAFLAVWDTREKNGEISYAEFCDYYSGVSASIDDDEMFEAVIFSSWHVFH